MFKLAKVHNFSLLLIWTSEIYGDPLEHPQKKTHWGNVNCVGESNNNILDTVAVTRRD